MDLNLAARVLQWGRRVDGRFGISVEFPVTLPDGTALRVQEATFVLTAQEEASLKLALTGIVVADAGTMKRLEVVH